MQEVRESIFFSALRSFASSFMSILGILLAVILVLFAFLGSMKDSLLPEPSTPCILPNAKGERKIVSMDAPAILCLRIDGIIGTKDLTGPHIQNILMDSREGILAHDRVKGILLYINSPGGSSIDVDNIYHAIKEYTARYPIPVYAYIEGLCASGGIYLACTAQKIFATSSSIIGSVGVRLGPAFNVAQAMDKLGVKAVTLTEGKDKDMLNPFRNWVDGEDQSLKDILATDYEMFVNIVTSARPNLPKNKLVGEYGAQVFIAKKAQEIGFIDVADATYSSCLKELLQASHIDENKDYQVVELSTPKSFLTDLSSSSLVNVLARYWGINPDPMFSLRGKILYLYEPLAPAM